MEYIRPLWNCLNAFCNCLRCAEEADPQFHHEPSERTYLLADPTSHNSPALRRTNSDNLSNEFSQSLPQKDDNALCRLVQNTAINMIDVGAMDSHNLEHQEYNDRIKLYSQRLQQQWNNIQHPGNLSTGFLKDVPNAEYHLVKSISTDDLIQITNALKTTQLALMDIKIDFKEAIVVPFRIP